MFSLLVPPYYDNSKTPNTMAMELCQYIAAREVVGVLTGEKQVIEKSN